jgi:hypothetical protein
MHHVNSPTASRSRSGSIELSRRGSGSFGAAHRGFGESEPGRAGAGGIENKKRLSSSQGFGFQSGKVTRKPVVSAAS